MPTATEYAADLVASVRDDPAGRVALIGRCTPRSRVVPSCICPTVGRHWGSWGWQLRRGLLDPLDDDAPGSPWWRAVTKTRHAARPTCRAPAAGRPA